MKISKWKEGYSSPYELLRFQKLLYDTFTNYLNYKLLKKCGPSEPQNLKRIDFQVLEDY